MAATAAGLVAVVAAAVSPPAGAAPVSYVALGDSYTAAPLVLPPAPGAPPDCLRSAINYPHLVAAAAGLALQDRSCSSATTANMTTAQYADQPPQFNALSASTGVVTIGIGGNDHDLFVSALVSCGVTDVLDLLNIGTPCRNVFGTTFADEARGDGPAVGAALAGIHARAPQAKVFVVGYPDILPQQGNCYPQLPLTTGDVAYLNGVEMTLNAMLQQQAAAHGATFVDTFAASIGHDACKAEGVRWIEPVVPGTDAFPVHPNAKGEAADARAVEAAFQRAGLG
ncbi:MAG TPA: SGNH/GDSL hydrolase family protein [Acidimicrobiales bacterium]|nr:SGNH/GDSL hydrolase family protein [Acidimicrobiales bacterium]